MPNFYKGIHADGDLRGNGKTYTEINHHILLLKEKAKNFDGEEIRRLLKQLIPEYQPEKPAGSDRPIKNEQ